MTYAFGRQIASRSKAALAWLNKQRVALLRARTVRSPFAVIALTVRLALLLAAPIIALLIVLGFIGSAQGREAVALATQTSRGVAALIVSACLFLAVIAHSCHLVLAAYRRRLEERLSSITPRSSASVGQFLRDWLGWCLCLAVLLIIVVQELRPGWPAWAVLATVVASIAWGSKRFPRSVRVLRRWSGPVASVVLTLVLAAGVVVSMLDVPLVRDAIYALGPLPIAFFGLAFWGAVGAVLLVALPIRFGLPSLLVLPLILAAWWSSRSDYNEISLRQPVAAWGNACDRASMASLQSTVRANRRNLEVCNRLPMLNTYFRNWLTSIPLDKGQDYIPVFLVAAEGGGIRAAYWTESVLNRLDQETQGKFSRHVFAISGVSGGTVGMLAYYDRLKHRAEGRTLAPGAGSQVFREDLLSPIVFGLLFPDALRNIVGSSFAPPRAALFEQAMAKAWERATGSRSFHENFVQSFAVPGSKGLPLLIANATVAESGHRFLVSNVALHPDHFPSTYIAFDPSAPYDLSHLSGSQVAHLSARFPFVSPAASIRAFPSDSALLYSHDTVSRPAKEGVLWGHLVDGGYFENSGATTLLDLYRALQRTIDDGFARVGSSDGIALLTDDAEREFLSRTKRIRFYVLSIRNDPVDYHAQPPTHPREPPEPYMLHAMVSARNLLPGEQGSRRNPAFRDFDTFAELVTPPRAMLATREARGSASRVALQWAVNGSIDAGRDCRTTNTGLAGNIQCSAYGSNWLEANLAEAIFDDRDEHKCVETVAERPALGWALERKSADLMDCVQDQNNSVGAMVHRVGVIMDARSRASMDYDAYQILEGWRLDRTCRVSAGKARLDNALDVPTSLAAKLDTSCYSRLPPPADNYAQEPVRATPCEEAVRAGKASAHVSLATSAIVGDLANLKCLLGKGTEVNSAGEVAFTPLLYALQHKHAEAAWALLRAGALVDVRTPEGITPLLASADWAPPDLIRELVRRGADVQRAADTGITPASLAARSCRHESFMALLEKKPDLAVRDQWGRTAADWAKAAQCPAIVAAAASFASAPR